MAKEISIHARTPEGLHRLFAEVLSAHDLDDIMLLFARRTHVSVELGSPARTEEEIRESLDAFLAMEPVFDLGTVRTLAGGDLVVMYCRWTMTRSEMEPLDGWSVEIARRQRDGCGSSLSST